MTQLTTFDARARVSDAADGLLARLRRMWADYRLYSATVQELQQLSDRELADLGIHRSSIQGIARDSVYRA